MKALIHTCITKKNIIFVDNYIGSREYIDTGPLFGGLKNMEEKLEQQKQ